MELKSGVDFNYSGGSANSDPELSTGGQMSSVRVVSQTVSYPDTALAGVTLINGSGNSVGTGQLKYDPADESFVWKPAGATAFGVKVQQSTTETPEAFLSVPVEYGVGPELTIQVVAASLPAGQTTVNVLIADILDEVFTEPTADEIKAGDYIWRLIYVTNKGLTDRLITATSDHGDINLWFDEENWENVTTGAPAAALLSKTDDIVLRSGITAGLWIAFTPSASASVVSVSERTIGFTSVRDDGLLLDGEEITYTGLQMRFENPIVGLPDPTTPVPIAEEYQYTSSTGKYICDPYNGSPVPATISLATEIKIIATRYFVELQTADETRVFPTSKFVLIKRGCYVTTPERLDITLALTEPERDYFRTTLTGKARLIIEQETADGVFRSELYIANINEYTIEHSPDEITCFVQSTKKQQYNDPQQRNLEGFVISLLGDCSDYTADKKAKIAGSNGLLINPQDYIDLGGGDGLWADVINVRVWETGIETFVTQFGR